MVKDCVANGQYDVSTMGSVANVGLMAQKAEEYGSHPTTFEMAEAGKVTVTAEDGTELMSFDVEAGDIWRMSRAKDIPIKDWVRLAVERASIEKVPTIFWLDSNRTHDAEIIKKLHFRQIIPSFHTHQLIETPQTHYLQNPHQYFYQL